MDELYDLPQVQSIGSYFPFALYNIAKASVSWQLLVEHF